VHAAEELARVQELLSAAILAVSNHFFRRMQQQQGSRQVDPDLVDAYYKELLAQVRVKYLPSHV